MGKGKELEFPEGRGGCQVEPPVPPMTTQPSLNLSLLNKLPLELVQHIMEFIPTIVSVFLSKKLYLKYHDVTRKHIPLYENYVRDMVRNDYHFVFSLLLKESMDYWSRRKKYNYKDVIYYDYNYFLLEYCIENKSSHCKNLIRTVVFDAPTYANRTGLSKNQHKKNIRKNVRWTN